MSHDAETLFQRWLDLLRDGRAPEAGAFVAQAEPVIRDALRAKLEEFRSICGAFVASHERLAAGEMLGPYRLVRQLGSGGCGVVWEAEEPSLQRRVALKILHLVLALETRAENRLQREAKALVRIDHPAILQVHAIHRFDGHLVLAMELVPGGRTLADEIAAARGKVPATQERRRTVRRMLEAAEAVAASHQAGVLHRDLKPSNLLVDEHGVLRVADFGLAEISDAETLTLTRDSMGTPPYLPPEPLRGEPFSERTDVWSFGATLFEALTSERPFAGATPHEMQARILHSEPDWPSGSCGLPADLQAICARALRKDPQERYASMAELASDLRAWLDGRPTLARPPGPLERGGRWLRRNKAAGGVMTVVLASLVVVLVFFGQARRSARFETIYGNALSIIMGTLDPYDPKAARESLSEVEDIIIDELEGQATMQAELAADLANVYLRLEEHEAAARNFQSALEVRKEPEWIVRAAASLAHLGEDSRNQALTLLQLIAARDLSGDIEDDLSTLAARNRQVVVSVETVNAHQDPVMSNEDGLKVLQEVADELTSRNLQDHWLTRLNKLNLATQLSWCGRDQESIDLFQEVRADFERVGQEAAPDYGHALCGERNALWHMGGHMEEAREIGIEALAHFQMHRGPNDTATLVTQVHLANIVLKLGDEPEARRLAEDVLKRAPYRGSMYQEAALQHAWSQIAPLLGLPVELPARRD